MINVQSSINVDCGHFKIHISLLACEEMFLVIPSQVRAFSPSCRGQYGTPMLSTTNFPRDERIPRFPQKLDVPTCHPTWCAYPLVMLSNTFWRLSLPTLFMTKHRSYYRIIPHSVTSSHQNHWFFHWLLTMKTFNTSAEHLGQQLAWPGVGLRSRSCLGRQGEQLDLLAPENSWNSHMKDL